MIEKFCHSLHERLTFAALEGGIRRRRSKRVCSSQKPRILYVAYMCLPHHVNGYASRAHSLLKALRDIVDVRALTRAGYPWDMGGENALSYTDYDGARYDHMARPKNNVFTAIYARLAAARIADYAIRNKITLIHAASNHVNALPALIAARWLGLPFQYEMRGLWELSRAAGEPSFADSQVYRLGLKLEGWTAKQADRVFVISEQLAKYARTRWGIPDRKLSLLPNCVEVDDMPQGIEAKDGTIGYAGSLLDYEGLDDLIRAVAILRNRGMFASLNIIGDGDARAELENLARRLGVWDAIVFHGKRQPSEARRMLAGCSLACLPRKPFAVCEIVPPLKLVEALALRRPVVVPDLPVFRDELASVDCGFFFTSGDSENLADTLAQALSDKQLLAEKGERGGEYVNARRQWRHFVNSIITDEQARYGCN